MSILQKLKIHGFTKSHENAILASLFLGEPLLFMGPKGVAKTEVVACIGMALREASKRKYPNDPSQWFTYQIYDASKLNFEDLIGYPSPSAMKANPPRVEYIPTPSTIWGKNMVAFDELNRCQEDRQSNLFEIIRSRKLQGIPTGNQFIYSTINPYGDVGTILMSDALVDRHLFYLRVPNFSTMPYEDRQKIINRVGNFDGVGLRYWANLKGEFDTAEQNDTADQINDKLADIGDQITDVMSMAATKYNEMTNEYKDNIASIINELVKSLSDHFSKEKETVKKEIELSGRRASAMLRGILAMRAVDLAMVHQFNGKMINVVDSIINAIKLTIPIGISGNLDSKVLDSADKLIEEKVKLCWEKLNSNKNEVDNDQYSYLTSVNSVLPVIDSLFNNTTNDITRCKIFSTLLKTKYKDETAPGLRMSMALYLLSKDFPVVFKDIPVKEYTNDQLKKEAATPLTYDLKHLSKYEMLLQHQLKTILNSKYNSLYLITSAAIAIETETKNRTESDAIEFMNDLSNLINTVTRAYSSIAEKQPV